MENQTIQICPLCDQVVGKGVPVSWTLMVNSREAEFQVRCCAVDADLCSIFPSLKKALWKKETTQELLRRLTGT